SWSRARRLSLMDHPIFSALGWPPSQGWRTFLINHVDGIAAIDLFVLPTITSTVGIVRDDDKSDGGVDFAPDHRGVSVWDSAPRYFGTGTLRMVRSSGSGCVPWAFGTGRLRPDRRGRIRTSRD